MLEKASFHDSLHDVPPDSVEVFEVDEFCEEFCAGED